MPGKKERQNSFFLFQKITVKAFLLCLTFVLEAYPIFANKKFNFKHLTIENGLSQSWVRCILQDKYGFMWFGTDNGLNRYDGSSFVVYMNDPANSKSLSNSRINALYEDKDGNIWVGTLNGLNLFDRKTNTFSCDPSWPSSRVTSIAADKQENLWIGTHSGLYFLDKHTQKASYCAYATDKNKVNNLAINKVYVDKENNVWIATMNGLNVIKSKTKQVIFYTSDKNRQNSLSHNDVRCLFEDRQRRLWLGTAKGIDIFTNAADVPETAHLIHIQNNSNKKSLNEGAVQVIFQDNKGRILIGIENGGLDVLHPQNLANGKFEFDHHVNIADDDNSLSNNSIYSIFQDNQNSIWVGTHGDGLNIYNPLNEKFELVQNSTKTSRLIINNQVNAFVEDEKYLWVGTEGGLSCYDKKTRTSRHFEHNPANKKTLRANAVLALLKDKSGHLFIGGMKMGLSQFDFASGHFIHYKANPSDTNSLRSDNIFALYQDSKGRIWAGQNCGGLSLFDFTTKKFKTFRKNKDADDCIKAIAETPDGKLWLINATSIECFDPESGSFTTYTNNPSDPESLSSNYGFSIFTDSKGALWVGTDAGLNVFDYKTKKFKKKYTIKNGLPDNAIKSINEDNFGNLWIGTDKGLSKFVNATEQPSNPRFINYKVQDGLQANEFRKRATYKNAQGKLYFGGINGFNAFYPDSIAENKAIPNVVITELLIFNQKVNVGDADSALKEDISIAKEITLSYRHSVFTLKFAALNFIAPAKNQYAYKMEGFDKEWNIVGNKNEATYTNLSPGKYTFVVKASNNDGIWNQKGRSLTITILPPWWKTWWFQTLFYLFIGFMIFAIIQFRTAFYKKQNEKLAQMVKERTLELEEINVNLEEKQEEINEQNEELLTQRAQLEHTNELLVEHQLQISQQNEELMSQRDALEIANKELEKQKAKILEQNIELDKHRNELESLVEIRTQQLIQAKDKAEEADRLKSSFLANLSHEIRTPLNAIIGFSNLVIDGIDTPEEKENIRQIIYSSSESLLGLINDIIDFSKIESGHIDIILKEVPLKKIMADIQSIFQLQLKRQQIGTSHNIDFRVIANEQLNDIYLETDEVRIKQILSNLIHNAIKFTLKGSIEVGCHVLGDNEIVEFYVKDTGIGIKKENLQIIFERFRKIEDDKTHLHRGAGIGLAITQQLVSLLGGQIRVESEHGIGTTFYFTIPVKKNPEGNQTQSSNAIAENITDFKNVKVLVAEDDLANYAYIERLLLRFNINVVHALNGTQAIYLLTKIPDIKLVLMDIKMPLLDGIQALHQIKERKIDIPVVAQTAYALSHEVVKLKEEGFDDYIAKPLSLADISRVLHRWIKI